MTVEVIFEIGTLTHRDSLVYSVIFIKINIPHILSILKIYIRNHAKSLSSFSELVLKRADS